MESALSPFHRNILIETGGIKILRPLHLAPSASLALPLSMSSPQHHRPTSPRRGHELTNTQMLSQLMQKKRFSYFQWLPSQRVDNTGRVWHLARCSLYGQLLNIPESWRTTAADAREATAFYALPIVSAAIQQIELQIWTASSSYSHH